MKEAPERVPNRNGLRYSAADKLKAVKLYLGNSESGKVPSANGSANTVKKVLALSRLRRRKVLLQRKNPIRPGSLSERKFSNTKPHIRIMASNGSLRSSAAFSVCRSKLMKFDPFCRHIRHRQRRPRPAPGVLPLRCGSSNGVLPMNYGTPT